MGERSQLVATTSCTVNLMVNPCGCATEAASAIFRKSRYAAPTLMPCGNRLLRSPRQPACGGLGVSAPRRKHSNRARGQPRSSPPRLRTRPGCRPARKVQRLRDGLQQPNGRLETAANLMASSPLTPTSGPTVPGGTKRPVWQIMGRTINSKPFAT